MPAPIPARRHRLPQRLSWSLIPPPLDLSKPLVDENEPLPAIIVTPSSPVGSHDFQIAFLASKEPKHEAEQPHPQTPHTPGTPSKAPGRKRHAYALGNTFTLFDIQNWKPKTYLLLFIPVVVLVFHVLAHQMIQSRPLLRFDFDFDNVARLAHPPAHGHGGMGVEALRVSSQPPPPPAVHHKWIGLEDFTYREVRHPRDFNFVVEERREKREEEAL